MGNKLKPKRLQIPALEAELFELYYNSIKCEKYSRDMIYISVTTKISFM